MSRDSESADNIIRDDDRIDELEEEIDQLVVRLLATRQPMAIDLRVIAMALKISNDLERMGDYAANVAKRSVTLAQFALSYPLAGLTHMGQLAQGQIKLVMDALDTDDVNAFSHPGRYIYLSRGVFDLVGADHRPEIGLGAGRVVDQPARHTLPRQIVLHEGHEVEIRAKALGVEGDQAFEQLERGHGGRHGTSIGAMWPTVTAAAGA